MNFVAFRMLVGDTAKYLGLIFAVAFSTFLLQNQTSIFANLLKRAGNQIRDVTDADVWVMSPRATYFDEVLPLKETDLQRVRSVEGVEYAVRFFKGLPLARTSSGHFVACNVIGLDESTLAGAPRRMIMGDWRDLWQPNSIVIDQAGYTLLFPGEPLALHRSIELNDHRVTIRGISDAMPAFTSFPIVHARYSEAIGFQGRQRQQLSYVIARAKAGISPQALAAKIQSVTGLKAQTTAEFQQASVRYILKNTGIPVNFGITIFVSILVGLVVTAQTFYLFTVENLKQFGALKAIGVTHGQLIGMVIAQAILVWFIGTGFGSALTATFFHVSLSNIPTRHFIFFWQTAVGVAAFMLAVILFSSSFGLRKVLRLQPAEVFR